LPHDQQAFFITQFFSPHALVLTTPFYDVHSSNVGWYIPSLRLLNALAHYCLVRLIPLVSHDCSLLYAAPCSHGRRCRPAVRIIFGRDAADNRLDCNFLLGLVGAVPFDGVLFRYPRARHLFTPPALRSAVWSAVWRPDCKRLACQRFRRALSVGFAGAWSWLPLSRDDLGVAAERKPLETVARALVALVKFQRYYRLRRREIDEHKRPA